MPPFLIRWQKRAAMWEHESLWGHHRQASLKRLATDETLDAQSTPEAVPALPPSTHRLQLDWFVTVLTGSPYEDLATGAHDRWRQRVAEQRWPKFMAG
jgi:hypothetical protein